uniref:F-box domain-containing protein n=1 Tax=Davidia involucrata TaxID=16924 RepID=A0A5B7BKJ2_DAVIN
MEGTRTKRQKTLAKKDKKAENPRKRDFLSELPESLCHHIFSYLTMEEVIRTSLLGKRWRYFWLSVPCLNFTSLKMSSCRKVAFIDRSLVLHKGPKVQKLSISLKYRTSFAYQVNSWIHFALTRNIDELYLDFLNKEKIAYSSWYPFYCGFKLPNFIFDCGCLKVLALNCCDLILPEKFKLSSLKVLYLEHLEFSGGTINDLISSSPFLEDLSMINCNRRSDLNIFIMNVGMKSLKIHEYNVCLSSTNLEIYAPYLLSFEIHTSMSRKNYVVKRMQSLENASFDCCGFHTYCGELNTEDKGYSIVKILDEVCHVKDLRLGSCYIQVLSMRQERSPESLSFDAACLGLKTGLTEWELPGISYMLRHLQHVETLMISIDKVEQMKRVDESNGKCDSEAGQYWNLQEPHFTHLLQNLKTVKINNFMKNLSVLQRKHISYTDKELLEQLQNDMNFLRFLLKNSKMLERVIIITCKDIHFGKSVSKKMKLLFQLTKELLAFPRASRDAEISFS